MDPRNTPKIAVTTTGGLDGCVEIAVGILVMSMFALLSVQIFFRYVLNNSIVWAEEVVRCQFAWMIFLGAAVNVRRKAHIVIDILVRKFPDRIQNIIEVMVHAQLLLIFVVMTYKGAEFTYMCRYTQSMSIDVSLAYLYGAVPVAFALMTKSHIQLMRQRFFPRGLRSLRQEG